jgi:hypothetical protein
VDVEAKMKYYRHNNGSLLLWVEGDKMGAWNGVGWHITKAVGTVIYDEFYTELSKEEVVKIVLKG